MRRDRAPPVAPHRPTYLEHTPPRKRRLTRRRVIGAGAVDVATATGSALLSSASAAFGYSDDGSNYVIHTGTVAVSRYVPGSSTTVRSAPGTVSTAAWMNWPSPLPSLSAECDGVSAPLPGRPVTQIGGPGMHLGVGIR